MQRRKNILPVLILKTGLATVALAGCALLLGNLSHSASAGTRHPLIIAIIGGGTSHNFAQNYQQTDAQLLAKAGDSVTYTESWAQLAPALTHARVLVQATNQLPPPDPAEREALMKYVAAGGGLLVVHAGLWYNWPAWPEYNRVLLGGGSHSHDKLGSFEVTVTHPEHPIMRGVPQNFMIHDELYHEETDPAGTPIEVLATATSPITGKTFPSVWVVQGKHGKIACIALGHDQESHSNPAYIQLLTNAAHWVAR